MKTVTDLAEIERLVEVAMNEHQALLDLGTCMANLRAVQEAKAQLEEFDPSTVRRVLAQRDATEVRCA
ncbi:hypothetical protein JNO54_00155 [Janibacter sp. YIM B02568]|uniref:hypothetical protein n=1 Tax=Janibacter endophyticus TaxID=2806261 RepID=UPI001950B948|nr:hypothetical protein [Janibacter endophyticus]MBM6544559.1 hypothetical protein [Janibacter endophyticus]